MAIISGERPKVPPSHTQAHILNTPSLERTFARAYLSNPESPEAIDLRRRIADGSRRALEDQCVFLSFLPYRSLMPTSIVLRYWDIIERTVQQNPIDAGLGGDPSPANKVRAFLNVQYYRGGAWESSLEVS